MSTQTNAVVLECLFVKISTYLCELYVFLYGLYVECIYHSVLKHAIFQIYLIDEDDDFNGNHWETIALFIGRKWNLWMKQKTIAITTLAIDLHEKKGIREEVEEEEGKIHIKQFPPQMDNGKS